MTVWNLSGIGWIRQTILVALGALSLEGGIGPELLTGLTHFRFNLSLGGFVLYVHLISQKIIKLKLTNCYLYYNYILLILFLWKSECPRILKSCVTGHSRSSMIIFTVLLFLHELLVVEVHWGAFFWFFLLDHHLAFSLTKLDHVVGKIFVHFVNLVIEFLSVEEIVLFVVIFDDDDLNQILTQFDSNLFSMKKWFEHWHFWEGYFPLVFQKQEIIAKLGFTLSFLSD